MVKFDVDKLASRLERAKSHRDSVGDKGTVLEQRAARKQHKRASRRLVAAKIFVAKRDKSKGKPEAATEE